MSSMAAVIGWYGPYRSLEDARWSANNDNYSDYLYAVFGYHAVRTRGRPTLLYIGVGSKDSNRLVNQHSTIGSSSGVTITSMWLGEIGSHRRAGRRPGKREPLIDFVEGALISLLAPRLNIRRRTFPRESMAVVNRWWSCLDWETPIDRPIALWPDLIECASGQAPVHFVYLKTKRIKTIKRP